MFERLDSQARQVVDLAQDEARTLGHDHIGTEHLLLGLLRQDEGAAATTLLALGISLEPAREQVRDIVGQGSPDAPGDVPFTPRAKQVVELSLREALRLGHNHVGPEHLLLGLLREGHGVGAQVLIRLGADLKHVRQQLIRLLSESHGPDRSAFSRLGRPRR